MSKCSCETTTMDMTYDQFQRWAAEYLVDGFLQTGLKGMQSSLNVVIQQQAMIFSRNGGFQPRDKK